LTGKARRGTKSPGDAERESRKKPTREDRPEGGARPYPMTDHQGSRRETEKDSGSHSRAQSRDEIRAEMGKKRLRRAPATAPDPRGDNFRNRVVRVHHDRRQHDQGRARRGECRGLSGSEPRSTPKVIRSNTRVQKHSSDASHRGREEIRAPAGAVRLPFRKGASPRKGAGKNPKDGRDKVGCGRRRRLRISSQGKKS